MKIVYIAGPYRNKHHVGQVTNIAIAHRYAVATWAAGYYALCPHLNTQMFDNELGSSGKRIFEDDAVFLEGYKKIITMCDAVVVLPNHHESEGTMAEIAIARALDIPVIQCPDQSNRLDTLIALMKNILDQHLNGGDNAQR